MSEQDKSQQNVPAHKHHVDIAIIGGGIAGLWLLNKLCNEGYNAILFEQEALGGYQTVASQGMVHGGIKYTLSGAISGASEAIANMPEHWRQCMAGEGDINLSGAKILSDHFYMFSSNTASSKMTTFLASKAMRGRVDKVAKDDRPELFQYKEFSGPLYRLVDMVLDVPSVIKSLADNYAERIWKIDWTKAELNKNSSGEAVIKFDNGAELTAGRFVFTAGKGTEKLLKDLDIHTPETQRRPLQQVMVKHNYHHRFYGHCLGAEKTPRLTISSHPCKDGQQVWYLGGSLAEKGVGVPADQLIKTAQQELKELMPWVDLGPAQWATLNVDRAEPKQRNFARPDQAFASVTDNCSNVIAAWPTKLSLAPNLADEVFQLLESAEVKPSNDHAPNFDFLTHPEVAENPWDVAFD
jgi:glycerol-3-phosphate dehydrogenase